MTTSGKIRTLREIQDKIDRGDVVVVTAHELCNRVRRGEIIGLKDVDVVTAATCAVMSGTYAVLSFKVTEPDVFVKADKVWINGVPAQVGPCPNERIGLLDVIVLGTSRSREDTAYGGGHLFRDLVEGKTVQVDIITETGQCLSATTSIREIPLAMLYATRNAFKNYVAFVNPGTESIISIFHSQEFQGDLRELTFCGCGELNPLEKDPDLRTIGLGTRVMINGAQGYVSGPGTRSTRGKPNLAGFADMHRMHPGYMGGFMTSQGPDVINTWAVAIPVLDGDILKQVLKTDQEIRLKVVDVRNRVPIYEITYGDVWQEGGNAVLFDISRCLKCDLCMVAAICPVKAVVSEPGQMAEFDSARCFNCGLCVSRCKGNAFEAVLGVTGHPSGTKKIPVAMRQSNRVAAMTAAQELKEAILSGQFVMNEPTEKIVFKD
ncbi:MAG: methanogenesis marker 16 metalloprotein [Pseudomonadota bacterium]